MNWSRRRPGNEARELCTLGQQCVNVYDKHEHDTNGYFMNILKSITIFPLVLPTAQLSVEKKKNY